MFKVLFNANFFMNIVEQLHKTLIVDDRYMLYLKGLGNTLLISLGAICIGVILGLLIALVRYIRKNLKSENIFIKILSAICNVYITIVRGTPVVLQLLILAFVVLTFIEAEIVVAMIAFGLNSAAYVAEIVRGGLEAVEDGQMEAGRSLGLNVRQSLIKIILPQAIRKALPPMGNEFIALIKETSVVGYISMLDITQAGYIIRSGTFEPFFPLLVSAVLYLIIVYLLTSILKIFERRLAKSDRN